MKKRIRNLKDEGNSIVIIVSIISVIVLILAGIWVYYLEKQISVESAGSKQITSNEIIKQNNVVESDMIIDRDRKHEGDAISYKDKSHKNTSVDKIIKSESTNSQEFNYKNGKLTFRFPVEFQYSKKWSKITERDVGYFLPKKEGDIGKLFGDKYNPKEEYMDNKDYYHKLKKKILLKKHYDAGKKTLKIYVFDFDSNYGENRFFLSGGVGPFNQKRMIYNKNIPKGYFKNVIRSDDWKYVEEEILIPVGSKVVGISVAHQADSNDKHFNKDKYQEAVEQDINNILETVKIIK